MHAPKSTRLIPLLIAAALISGCASDGRGMKRWQQCSLIGGGTGLLLGAIESTGAAAGGAVAGAILGGLLCHESDSDKDGVNDSMDQCPDTPEGVPVDAAGCPLDSDGDGVPDYLDLCPGTAEGVAVDASGCPLDSDADGVTDNIDLCPDTPLSTPVDANGCTVRILEDLGAIFFKFNSAVLSDSNKALLDPIVERMLADTQLKLKVYGFTSTTGTLQRNTDLSLQRARAVTDYMVSKGVSSDNLEAIGEGEILENNATIEGRKHNRKAVLFLQN